MPGWSCGLTLESVMTEMRIATLNSGKCGGTLEDAEPQLLRIAELATRYGPYQGFSSMVPDTDTSMRWVPASSVGAAFISMAIARTW